jgi:hypothetical protein
VKRITKRVRLALKDNTFVEVVADVTPSGLLAIHPRINGPDFALTHVPSGYQFCYGLKSQLTRFAEALDTRADALRFGTLGERMGVGTATRVVGMCKAAARTRGLTFSVEADGDARLIGDGSL